MKLLVRDGKKKRSTWFRPHLKIGPTGYARDHWQEQCFREGVFCGSGTYRERNVKEAVEHYFSELRRMKHIGIWVEGDVVIATTPNLKRVEGGR